MQPAGRGRILRSSRVMEEVSQSSFAPLYDTRKKQTAYFNLTWRPASEAEFLLLLYFTLLYFPYSLLQHFNLLAEEIRPLPSSIVYLQLATMIIGLILLWTLFLSCEHVVHLANHLKGQLIVSFVVSFVASLALLLVAERYFYSCPSQSDGWHCEFGFAQSTILLIPPALAVVFHTVSSALLWGAYFLCVVLKIATDIEQHAFNDLATSASEVLLTSMLLYALLNKRINASLAQISDLSREVTTDHTHMVAKHLIANVAHDLKTPVSSFMAGVHGISQALEDLSDIIVSSKASHLTTHQVCATMASIQQYANAMKNTNEFMLMTINRCIDYTKASKGLKLMPKYETIDLMETLSLPLNCMKDIQERVTITMEPIARHICSHIITDKQWLQENVLCLLSNAVKYSSGGTVTVKARLDSSNEMRVRGSFSLIPRVFAGASSKSSIQPVQRGGCDPVSSAIEAAVANTNTDSTLDPHVADRFEDYRHTFLCVEIEDNGIGMSDQAMQELFSPFKQNQRLAGGTGLGLFSLAQRVEALHGTCGVQRRRDGRQGSLFWFRIPYRPDFVTVHLAENSGQKMSVFETILEKESPPSLHSLAIDHCFSTDSVLTNQASTDGSVLGQSRASISTLLEAYNTASLATDSTARSMPSPLGAHNCMRILVVDDSHLILRMTSLMLRKLGYLVFTAENGAEALRIMEQEYDKLRAMGDTRRMRFASRYSIATVGDSNTVCGRNGAICEEGDQEQGIGSFLLAADSKDDQPVEVARGELCPADSAVAGSTRPLFDAILMDLQMPVMDGLEATRRLRSWEAQLPNAARHFVIGVSANSEDETIAVAKEAGFDNFLAKPFNVEAFGKIMKQRVAASPGGVSESGEQRAEY